MGLKSSVKSQSSRAICGLKSRGFIPANQATLTAYLTTKKDAFMRLKKGAFASVLSAIFGLIFECFLAQFLPRFLVKKSTQKGV